MEQRSSWEANNSSANKGILRVLRKREVNSRVFRGMPPVHIPSQVNPVHDWHPIAWRSILILSYHPRLCLPSILFPSGFATKTLHAFLLSVKRDTRHSRLISQDVIHFCRNWQSLGWSGNTLSFTKHEDEKRFCKTTPEDRGENFLGNIGVYREITESNIPGSLILLWCPPF
jgi:hypothetical protein